MYSSEIWYTEYNEFESDQRTFSHSYKVKEHLVKDSSEFQSIDIIDTHQYGKMLLLDGLVMTTEKDEYVYHDMITHVPAQTLKYHDLTPKKALVIGGGDGGTVRELLKNESIELIEMCEIDGKVVDYCKQHLPVTASKLEHEKVKVHIGDGVEFVQSKKNEYDIICIDSTDPFGPATGLFNQKFYSNVKKALKEKGIVTAQQESFMFKTEFIQKMNEMLRSVFRSVSFYSADIPTYPTGTWCFVCCSDFINPLCCRNNDFVEKIQFKSKYYNPYIHQGAFALPTFVEELLK